jgi:threonine synthase
MDISKASNFERFVFDLVGRDGAKVRELWAKVDAGSSFDISATPFFAKLPEFGFISGSNTHAGRLATIRLAYEKYGTMIDTHTADGLKVALEQRPAGMTTLVLETALPVKFEETIREALNRAPERPASLEGIERLPQRVEVMNPDVDAVKRFVVAHVGT